MTQASSLSPLIPLDYENTLVLAIELSKTKWVLAAQVPGLLRVKAKQTIEPKTEALLAGTVARLGVMPRWPLPGAGRWRPGNAGRSRC